jgi:type I restriction-modification system DNA methylase subunit
MEKNAAVKIIKETFENPFSKERFISLAKNLVKNLDTSGNFIYQGNIIPDAYEQSIQALERVGKYEDTEKNKIDILITRLKKDSTLEHARTLQRNFIAWYLSGSRGGDLKDAALVAFISPDNLDWRFSLVRMDYTIAESTTGRVKVETELTPARRFSFLVGEHESSHTAQGQLLPILEDDERKPLLADFEKAFNLEVVTREFFIKYHELFNDVKESLENEIKNNAKAKEDFLSKTIDSTNFAKKLLGQIVFLYFLQKKGWFGVGRDNSWGTGPKDFLRRLFENKVVPYFNFFNDILEPLFYEALAAERTDDFYSRFNCKIPFLNGGLFDPINNYDWIHSDIMLSNTLFSNDEKTGEGDIGTGILDIFDRYNFTVKEDEPLDKEVAVDPEMLGKVFENLLEVKDRKSKGTYYTPREVVHYMCQESIINYLDTVLNTGNIPLVKEKSTVLKLFGNPAFQQQALKMPGNTSRVPREDIESLVRMGEMAIEHDRTALENIEKIQQGIQKTTKYQVKLRSIQANAELIDEALANIRVCDPAIGSGAFPVGLMMVIVRTRNILTTYLPDKESRTNYNFKRHAIQRSLYGVDIDPGAVEIAKLRLWLSLVVDEEDIKQIQPLPNLDYKIVCGNSLQKCEQDILFWPLFHELEKLKIEYFDETSKTKKADLKLKIDTLMEKIKGKSKDFNFTVDFSEVFPLENADNPGFDIIIANPPYIRQEQIKELKPELQKFFSCYSGTADIYIYFYERGRQILKKGGTLTYISSNKYFRAGYGEKLRRFLGNNCQVCQIIDFGDAPVFEAIAYPSIIVLKNIPPQENDIKILNWQPGPPLSEFASVVDDKSVSLPQKELTPDGWRLESLVELRLLEKLRKAGKPLGEYVGGRFYRGILTGLNEAFVVDQETRDMLITEHFSSTELLKPFLRGKDVKRWNVNFSNVYLIKIESSENKVHPWSGKTEKEAEAIFATKYPAIYKWLVKYHEKLVKRDDQGKYYWELRSCRYWEEFEQSKITYPNICKRNEFSWDDKRYYTNQKSFIIPGASKYLLAILNSSVVTWLFDKTLAKLQNGFYEPSAVFMKDFPIPINTSQGDIENIVDKILSTKAKDPKADVSEIEHQIDQLVYQLFGLTLEEIVVVEGNK